MSGPKLAGVVGACVALALALAGTIPARARADGDPASDVLLVQNVFYPYQPKVGASLEAALEKALRALAQADGVHLKVALIHSAPELGLVPEYFGRAQAYAAFLDREISFNQPQSLLTVMPSGFGVIPAGWSGALRGLHVNAAEASDGLTRAAIAAVVALARYRGHPIATPSLTSSSRASSSPGALVFAAPILVLLLVGAGVAARRRAGSERSD